MSSPNSSSLDTKVEQLGRWTAKRTTRRSFLHRFSQLAVFVAVGPLVSNLLLRKADARVCGQSGVTPKCDTFGCDGEGAVWGWCWYASDGCCKDDGLKKICDCCVADYPNVHGYCPAGTNVACIVESCGNDPRLNTVDLTPVVWNEHNGYLSSAALAGNESATKVVIVEEEDPWRIYVAAPLAGALGVPLLTCNSDGLSDLDTEIISQLGVTQALVVGDISGSAANALDAAGLTSRSVAQGTEIGAISQAVAEFIVRISNVNRSVSIATTGLSADAAPLAATFAAIAGFPIVIGESATAELGLPTLYIGPEPSDAGVQSERTQSTSLAALSIELADLAAALRSVAPDRVALCPDGSSDVVGMVNLGALVVLHPAGALGPVEDWILQHARTYGALSEVFHVKGPGELTVDQYWSLQGAINGFETNQLTGESGEGLPVIRQPYGERPIGQARTDGAPELRGLTPPSYWTSLGQTFRG